MKEHTDNTRIDFDQLADVIYSATFSDACDRLGRRAQTVDPRIVPHTGRGRTLIGWARVARFDIVSEAPDRHYGREIDFIDSLKDGDVVVLSSISQSAALWGELFSAASMARGARGAIIDGNMRDHDRVEAISFPVYATGRRPADSLGRVSLMDDGGPIELGGVLTSNRDLIVADSDGVVVVPADIAEEAIRIAYQKSILERAALQRLTAGALLSQAWEEFGVL